MEVLKVGTMFVLTLVLVASLGDARRASSCGFLGNQWYYKDPECPSGTQESFTKLKGRMYLKECCYDRNEAKERGETFSKMCETSQCITDGSDPCSDTESVRVGRKVTKKDKVNMRDECTDKFGRKGVAAVCCPSDSTSRVLLSVYGAEMNEFPHHADVGGCGGTVYNKDFIVTAAHCIIDEKGDLRPNLAKTVLLGTNMGKLHSTSNTFEVDGFIVHEKYSSFRNQSAVARGRIFNDIALVKLKKSINFDEHPKIKALKIAPENFNPSEQADQVIIVGWGTSIDLTSPEHLQKTNLPIRTYQQCYGKPEMELLYGFIPIQKKSGGPYARYAEIANSLLCIGGVVNGSYAEIAGHGDSGGPAICRDKDGFAVLCGVTSFSSTDDDVCAAGQSEATCTPSIYTAVSHFRQWIEDHAGPQDPRNFYTVPLYGQAVPAGKYKNQVHIEAKDGTVCGGTLVSQDKVVTAAHCIFDESLSKPRSNVKVYAGISDLRNKGEGNMYKVIGAVGSKNFARYHEMDQLASQKYKTMKNGYYIDDIAIVKLDRKVSISEGELPKLATGHSSRQGSSVEVAFPLDTSRSGSLMQRAFKILDANDCQLRLERLSQLNVTAKFDTQRVFCGVEKYSGGSICDREDGGGVFCKNEQGEDELCGIQTFRLCRTAIPSAFLSVRTYADYIKESMAALDKA